jgi:hypothetical protein
MTETLARLEDLKKQNAELEGRVAWLESQLEIFDVTFAIKKALPSSEEAAKLLRLVVSRYPHMREQNTSERDQVANFKCALAFVWSLTVTKEPTKTFSGSWWTSEAEKWCYNSRIAGRPRTLLPAIIVSDVPFHLDHSSLFLDPYRSKGTAIDRQAWRRLLNGGELRQAIPIKQTVDDRSIGYRKVLATTW